jgi:hypothetical protein
LDKIVLQTLRKIKQGKRNVNKAVAGADPAHIRPNSRPTGAISKRPQA